MSTTTTHTSNDTAGAQFLAPETHPKTAAQSQAHVADAQASDLSASVGSTAWSGPSV
jgi:hypothetical protein